MIKQLKAVTSRDRFLIMFIFCLFSLFFVGGPGYYSNPAFIQFWNIGHIIFFTLSNYLIIKLLRKNRPMTRIFIIILFTIVSGIIIELLQSKVGRTVDWKDIYRDLLGAALAIALFLPSQRKFKTAKQSFLIIVLTLILFNQINLYNALKNNIQARISFPVLADFEAPYELKQWAGHSLTQSAEYKVSGLHSMKVYLLSGGHYSGFTFKHFPGNWENYQYLNFSLYNPDKSRLKFNIKITDYEHDNTLQTYNNRFNKQITLENGWNHISIALIDIIQSPKNREMDISDISQIGFFASNLQEHKIIYLDKVKLDSHHP